MYKGRLSPIFIIIFFCLSINSILTAKEGWRSVTSGYEYGHYALFFTSSATGYVSTEGGSILVTTDGGDSWTDLHLSNGYHPSDLFFLNKNSGWMTAADMRAFKTEDGGRSWNLMIQDTSSQTQYSTLESIHFVNEMTGFAVGWRFDSNNGYSSIIMKTSDGGSKWEYQTASNDWIILNSVYFTNDTTGWICGENGVLYYTENGGQDWQIEDIGTSAYLNSIFFINSTHGWIAGSGGIIFRTVDGGQNWIISDNPSFAYLISIHFADTNTGYSCGLDGTILKSTNGGASWVSQESGTENGLIDIHVVSADTVYCVGWYGTILKTTTGGIATPNIVETESKNPSEINLEQNYPNPFNPSTTIAFQVTELISEKAVIKIYSSIGELVQTVTKNINGTGYYSVSWNGESNNGDILPTGNYFYSINYGNTTRNGKMCLIK